jgi:hypothetical protein
MSFCCECCVLSGRGLCDELITCPEESYRLWCVVVCDLETSWVRSWPTGGCRAKKEGKKKWNVPPEYIPRVSELSTGTIWQDWCFRTLSLTLVMFWLVVLLLWGLAS